MKLNLAILVFVFIATACSPQQRADYPFRIGVSSDQYGVNVTYSPEDGVGIGIDADQLIDQNGK